MKSSTRYQTISRNIARALVFFLVVAAVMPCQLLAAQSAAENGRTSVARPQEVISQAWRLAVRGISFQAALLLKNVPAGWQPIADEEDKAYASDQLQAGYLSLMRWDQLIAERSFNAVRTAAESKAGRKSPDYVFATLGLGSTFILKQETNQAKEYVTEAAALIDDAFMQGGDKFGALTQLAVGYASVGEKSLAATTYAKAFAVAKTTAKKPIDYARVIVGIGPYFVYALEPMQSEAIVLELQDIIRKSVGENTIEYAEALRIAAAAARAYAGSTEIMDLYKKGKYQEVQPMLAKKNVIAQESLEAAVRIHEKLTPPRAGEQLESIKDLAMIYLTGVNQPVKAMELIEKGLALSHKDFQEKDPELFQKKALIHGADFAAQVVALSEAEAAAKRIYGRRDIQYSIIAQTLAGAYWGKYLTARNEADKQESLKYYDAWLSSSRAIYGEKSSAYAATLNHLAGIYGNIDKSKAAEFAKQAENILKKK